MSATPIWTPEGNGNESDPNDMYSLGGAGWQAKVPYEQTPPNPGAYIVLPANVASINLNYTLTTSITDTTGMDITNEARIETTLYPPANPLLVSSSGYGHKVPDGNPRTTTITPPTPDDFPSLHPGNDPWEFHILFTTTWNWTGYPADYTQFNLTNVVINIRTGGSGGGGNRGWQHGFTAW